MKTKLCVISIMIVFLLGSLPLNSYATEVTDEPTKKTPEPKEEIIEKLKAKNEEAVIHDKNLVEETTVKQQELVEKEKVYFGKKSHALDTNAKKFLNKTASWLMDNPATILVIEGHGNEYRNSERNLLLGELRAGSVKSYFIKQGINETRLRVVSYGAERSSRVAKRMRLKNWRVCFLVKEYKNE